MLKGQKNKYAMNLLGKELESGKLELVSYSEERDPVTGRPTIIGWNNDGAIERAHRNIITCESFEAPTIKTLRKFLDKTKFLFQLSLPF